MCQMCGMVPLERGRGKRRLLLPALSELESPPRARTRAVALPPSLLGTHPNTVSGAPSTAFESGSSPRSYPSIQMRHDWRLSLQVEMVGCLPQSRALHALALHGRSGTGRNSHPQVYLACWVTSIFLICFLSDAP